MATTATKTTAAVNGTTAAAATVLVWTLGQAGIDMPPEVAAAVGIILGGVLAWITRPKAVGRRAKHDADTATDA